jgi:hypothetical protein
MPRPGIIDPTAQMEPSFRSPDPASGVVERASRAGLRRALRWSSLLVLVMSTGAAAQDNAPASTASLGSRWSFGGGASVSVAPEDTGYFNYSTGAYSVLRLVRLDGSAAFRAGSRVTLVADVRLQGAIAEGGWQVRPYALFARIRPWSQTPLDIQVGLVPPVFGAFGRRAYGADNPLIGFPLGYQYVTTLRADALPASADELLSKRGSGWRVRYSIGNREPDYGVPLADGLRYPAGVEVHAGGGRIEAGVAVTTGSSSMPDSLDVGWRPQISARVAVRPVPGLVLGGSVSNGRFLTRDLTDWLGPAGAGSPDDQTAAGFDAEYSRGHLIVRAEGIASWWRLPQFAPPYFQEPLRAFALDVEARYRLLPGLYIALRVDGLDFSEVCGTVGCLPWDAPVQRVEAGGGFSIRRNIVLKGVYQYNWRDGSRHPRLGLAATQLVVWF